MSNRAQRRAAKKQQPRWQKLNHDQRLAALVKNGITPKDLEKAYSDGRLDGINGTYQICFAAACLALADLHGFGRKRCRNVMEQMQRHVIDTLTSAEAVQAVYKRLGLTLDFGDPENLVDFNDD